MINEKFEIDLVASIVCLLAGIILTCTSTITSWEIIIGVGLIVASWAFALAGGITIGSILERKKEKRQN